MMFLLQVHSLLWCSENNCEEWVPSSRRSILQFSVIHCESISWLVSPIEPVSPIIHFYDRNKMTHWVLLKRLGIGVIERILRNLFTQQYRGAKTYNFKCCHDILEPQRLPLLLVLPDMPLTHKERLLTWLVPLSAGQAALNLVLNLLGFTSVLAFKLFKQAITSSSGDWRHLIHLLLQSLTPRVIGSLCSCVQSLCGPTWPTLRCELCD